MPFDLLISQFQGSEIGRSLSTITRLLDRFDNPQHRLPPIIHITGTNGKGSTAALVSAALVYAGFKVHRLISPHLCHITERITLANHPVNDEVMASYLMDIIRMTEGKIGFSEAVTATALHLFSQVPADIVVLEVGIGGLYDGTNVVSGVCVSVITPISLDHQNILGPTYQHIAMQKSGIMRSGVPCVSAPQTPCVQQCLANQAEIKGTPLHRAGKDWFFESQGQGFRVQYSLDPEESSFFPCVGLVGAHQHRNAAVASMVLHLQNALSVPYGAIAEGFARVVWPGRLQPIVLRNKKGEALTMDVWIDGAHNEGGFALLAEHIRTQGWNDPESGPLMVGFGMLARKNSDAFWSLLAPLAHRVCLIESWGNELGTSLDSLKQGKMVSPFLEKIERFSTLDQFFQAIEEKKWGSTYQKILICGSLHLMGAILKTMPSDDLLGASS